MKRSVLMQCNGSRTRRAGVFGRLRTLSLSALLAASITGPALAATSLDKQGEVLYKQGEVLYQRLLSAPAGIVSTADASIAASLQKWARYYEGRQEPQRAELFQWAVVAVQRKLYSADSPQVKAAEQRLAAMRAGQPVDQWGVEAPTAEPSHGAQPYAVQSDTAMAGSVNHQRGKQLFMKAEALSQASQRAEALPIYTELVELLDPSLPESQQMLATALYRIGEARFLLEQFEQTQIVLTRAVQIMTAMDAPDPRFYARALMDLGAVLAINGQPEIAESMFARGLEVNRQVLALDMDEGLTNVEYYAIWKRKSGDYQAAERAYKILLLGYSDIAKLDSPELASTLTGLGDIYMAQRLYAKAENAYLKALKIAEKRQDRAHFEALYHVATLYFEQQDYIRAEPHYARARKLYKYAQPGEAGIDDRFGLWMNSATTARQLGHNKQAGRLLNRAVAMNDEIYSSSPQLGLDAMMREMNLLQDLKKYDEVIRLARIAISKPESAQGELEARRGLAYMYMGVAQFGKKNYPMARQSLNLAAEILRRVEPAGVVHVETVLAKVELMDGLITASDVSLQ